MTNKSGAAKKSAAKSSSGIPMPDESDLRELVSQDEFESNFGVDVASEADVNPGKIFGMTAGERMILSIIIFMAVTVLGLALLFATNTIVISQ